MTLDGWQAKLAVKIVKFIVLLHDIICIPIYFFIDQPWKKWKLDQIIWAKLEDEKDPYSCYVRQVHRLLPEEYGRETMDQLFSDAVARFGERECYGVREVLGEEEEVTNSGKVFKKLNLGKYQWLTFNQVNERIENISKGLLGFGVESKKPVTILAETRLEWMLAAQACLRINVPVVTLYATLGEDGIAHGIAETEVTHIITSSDLLPKIKSILPRAPTVTHLVYMEGRKDAEIDDIPSNIKAISFSKLEESGKNLSGTEGSFIPSKSDDLAILMYTSGSTGIPKGVMITHKNLIIAVKGIDDILNHPSFNFTGKDTYIAYLPLAHVLELAAEWYLSLKGARVGYSSPQTLTDFSTAVKRGEKGDLTVLKPTLMVAVPLMLDRIRKSILMLAGKEDSFTRLMFDFAVKYKNFWTDAGFRTPRLDSKLLKTYRDFMGGELRAIICGSAPLSPDTQKFIRACLSARVLQGYGLTETTACATAMDFDDHSVGRVGAPASTCRLRLVDWDEGNYHVKDQPNPRGEIVLGGESITLGYFKNPTQTQEAFKIEGGERWFYSGDIGEVFPNGTLKIIDRKKDLVKLQFGEYIALGKVEAELKTCPLVDNICVVGNGFHSYLIALVIPNQPNLKSLAKDLGKDRLSFKEMCSDKQIVKEVTERIQAFGKKSGLYGSELPQKVKLCTDDWVPESGLVTAALKLRRKFIEKHYEADIAELYCDRIQNGPSST